MPKNLLADLFAISQAARAAKGLQRGVTRATHQMLRKRAQGHHRDPSKPGPSHAYAGQRRYAATLEDVRDLFDQFAASKLGKRWTKTHGGGELTQDGFHMHVTYEASTTLGVDLAPRDFFSRWFEGLEARENARYDFGREQVEYCYVTTFTIVSTPHDVAVSYTTREDIDPRGTARRDVSGPYGAPQMPRDFGTIGDRFLAVCDASLRRIA